MSAGTVQVLGVTQRYGRAELALDDVTLTLRPGITALVGLNGAGKSTLLSVLSGGRRPWAGQVQLDGQDLYSRRRGHLLARVSLMPQHLTCPANLTAVEVVCLLGWMRGLSNRQLRARAERSLEAVGLHERRDSKVGQLSGGMQRRLALAQALVNEPDVLLLDEPSTGLDPQQRRRMVEIINDLPGTVLLSSHVMEDVVDTAAQVVVLHEGRVRFDDSSARLAQLAPTGASASRRAEAAFLHLIGEPERTS